MESRKVEPMKFYSPVFTHIDPEFFDLSQVILLFILREIIAWLPVIARRLKKSREIRESLQMVEASKIALSAVVTVAEVVKYWKKTNKSVMMQIYKERLIARQAGTGGTWLISKSSVIALWGNPVFEDETE